MGNLSPKNTMYIIHQYQNGNSKTTLYSDGTRIREIEGDSFIADFPENIDIKITNYCNMDHICGYCHEQSNTIGKHGDLKQLYETLKTLPSGIELAIGGGSTTSHPDLEWFLNECKQSGFVCNVTVNQLHLNNQTIDKIFSFINNDLIRGVGISYRNTTSGIFKFSEMMKSNNYNDAVIHLIAGIDDVSCIDNLKTLGFNKFLVLGYKTFGNGVDYYNKNKNVIDTNLKKWYAQLSRYFNSGLIISFDNLAITQLNIKRYFSKKEWELFYQGDDFTCSMYIDAVEQKYSPTSRSANRVSFVNKSIQEYFKNRWRYIEINNVNFQ